MKDMKSITDAKSTFLKITLSYSTQILRIIYIHKNCLQTQLFTDALIVGLIGCTIVLYLCHTISEISHEFFRRSKITKTIEIT